MSRATKKTKVKEATAAELGAIRELGPTAGLHTLGAHLRAAGGEARARRVMAALPEALAVTAAEAPVRNFAYRLGVETTGRNGVVGTAWARALWKDFGPAGGGEMLMTGCTRLIGMHVEVADRSRAGRWGTIDLLGLDSHDRLPVVVEMKGTKSQSSPLGALVDAVAYGLALKKAWPHRLRSDWARAVKAAGFGEPRLPVFLNRVTVIVAASETYWRSWEAALQTVHAFVHALRYQGFDTYFASLSERQVGGRVCGLTAGLHLLPRLGAADVSTHRSTM